MDISGADIEMSMVKDNEHDADLYERSLTVPKTLFVGEDSPATSSLGSGSAGSDYQTVEQSPSSDVQFNNNLYFSSPNIASPTVSNLSYPSYTSVSEQSMGIAFDYLAKNILVTKDWSYLQSGGHWGIIYGIALVRND